MSKLFVDDIVEKTSGHGVIIPGHVIQIQQTVFKDTFSTSVGPNFAEITGLRCNITPASTSNKVLIRVNLSIANQYYSSRGRLLRDGSVITDATGNQVGSRTPATFSYINYGGGQTSAIYDMKHISVEYLDSPSTTSAVQYGVDIGGYNTSFPTYVNRNHNYNDSSTYPACPISSITLMEIAQ
jgi:hypothetical protein